MLRLSLKALTLLSVVHPDLPAMVEVGTSSE